MLKIYNLLGSFLGMFFGALIISWGVEDSGLYSLLVILLGVAMGLFGVAVARAELMTHYSTQVDQRKRRQ